MKHALLITLAVGVSFLLLVLSNVESNRHKFQPAQVQQLKPRTVQARYYEDVRELRLVIADGEGWVTEKEGSAYLQSGMRFSFLGKQMTVNWVEGNRADALDWKAIVKDHVERMGLSGYKVTQLPGQLCYKHTVPGKPESDDCRPAS